MFPLAHQHLWFDYTLKMDRKKELSSETSLLLRNEGYSMWETAKTLKISNNGVYYSLQRTAQMGSNQNRKRSRRPWCTTKQEGTGTLESLVWKIGPQLAGSFYGKMSVSAFTVKERLWDAGPLSRVAKKKPYLRLANKSKILRWAKEHRHWTEEDLKKSVIDRQNQVWGVWITQKNICEMQNKWKHAGGVPDAICQPWWR